MATVEEVDMSQRFQASMVLSGVGDALGYFHGRWEFCHSGKTIHKELEQLGGLKKIVVSLPKWNVSDDTVMHLATAEAFEAWGRESAGNDKTKLFHLLAKKYKSCMNDMGGRAPGMTCTNSVRLLTRTYQIPFNPRGGGCGAAMRAMCIGLRFPRPEDIDDLVAVSIESGRMTHHHPTGFLGAFAAALFVSYAIQGKPVKSWGASMLNELPKCKEYLIKSGHCVEENIRAMNNGYFRDAWQKYLKLRGISDGTSEPMFPEKYGVGERDDFVKSVSFAGWGGASGHDAPMIAYDALLGCGNDWAELCSRSMFHKGDSDSTGVIAAACYGAMNGFTGVPENLYRHLEYRDRLLKAGKILYLLSCTDEGITSVDINEKDQPKLPPGRSELNQLKSINEEESQEPVESSQELVESSQEPVESSQELVECSLELVESSQNPVESSLEPVESSLKPVESSQEPGAGASSQVSDS